MSRNYLTEREQEIMTYFLEKTLEHTATGVSEIDAHKRVEPDVCKKFSIKPEFLAMIRSKSRSVEVEDPRGLLVRNAKILKTEIEQLKRRYAIIENNEERRKFLDERVREAMEFEKNMVRTLERIIKLLDDINPKTGEEHKFQVLESVRRQIGGKYSPLGYSTYLQTLTGIVAEMRKQDTATDDVIKSINSAQKTYNYVQANFYNFDPNELSDDGKKITAKWLHKVYCPHCPGYEAYKRSVMGETIDIPYTDIGGIESDGTEKKDETTTEKTEDRL